MGAFVDVFLGRMLRCVHGLKDKPPSALKDFSGAVSLRTFNPGEHGGLSVRAIRRFMVLAAVVLFISSCATTPVSEKKALILIPFEQEKELGSKAYADILKEEKLSSNDRLTAIVDRVGMRVAAVSDMPHLDWEFKLIESEEKNAFALPGGKVAFYEGILEVCDNEAGLAAVMGHEIAHAIARHGAQRITQELILTGLMTAAAVRLADDRNSDFILAALGVGATVGVRLPFSRVNESEADEIGLIYMARAGYDPREAVGLWQRFSEEAKGEPPEFLSTHPSHKSRIEELGALMPRALAEYELAPVKYGKGETLMDK